MTHPKAPRQSWRRRHCGWLFDVPANTEKLFQDKAFDFTDWEWHRNAAWRHRWEPVIFFMVAAGYVWQLIHVIIVSILVGLYHEFLVPRFHFPPASNNLTQAFGMITFCLSLLLVFRTNSSYSRWWEARTIWGSTVNLSRNYARQVMLWAPPERAYVARLGARWMAVAVHVKRAHLRHRHVGRVTQEAMHLLTPQEFNWLANWRSVPQGAAHVLAWVAANLDTDVMNQQTLQGLVINFIDNLGKCERILRTPLPTAYTRHTSRFLLVYVTLAPALLWSTLSWATPFFATFIAFLLLGTENIGVQIEEPFKVLPLDTICGAIEGSIKDMEKQYFGSCSLDHPATHADDEGLPGRMEAEAVAAVAKLEGLLVGKLPPSRHFPKQGLNTINSFSRRTAEFSLRDSLGQAHHSQSRAGSMHFGQRPHFDEAAAVGGTGTAGTCKEPGAQANGTGGEDGNPDSTGAPHAHVLPALMAPGAAALHPPQPSIDSQRAPGSPPAVATAAVAAQHTAITIAGDASDPDPSAAGLGAFGPKVQHLPKESAPGTWDGSGRGRAALPHADPAHEDEEEEGKPLMGAHPLSTGTPAPVPVAAPAAGPHSSGFTSSGFSSLPIPTRSNPASSTDGVARSVDLDMDCSVGRSGTSQDRLLPRSHTVSHPPHSSHHGSHFSHFHNASGSHHAPGQQDALPPHGSGSQSHHGGGIFHGMQRQLSRRRSVESEREQRELELREEEEEAKAAGLWG